MAKVQAQHETKVEHAHKEPKEKGPKLCARDKWVRATDRMVSRIDKQAKRLASAPEIVALYQSAVAQLCDASAQLAALPEDWKARSGGGRGTGTPVAEGSIVDVRAAKKAKLLDLLDEGEMSGLTVEKIAGSRLRVRTSTGVTLLLPRNCFQPVKA